MSAGDNGVNLIFILNSISPSIELRGKKKKKKVSFLCYVYFKHVYILLVSVHLVLGWFLVFVKEKSKHFSQRSLHTEGKKCENFSLTVRDIQSIYRPLQNYWHHLCGEVS